MLNRVTLIGHLGRDPEVRILPNGSTLASFSLATNETYKDKNSGEKIEKTEWHRVSMWGRVAEVAGQYLKKGSLICIEGKITTRSYEQDGITKYITEIVARDMTMLGRNQSSDNSVPPSNKPPQQYAATTQTQVNSAPHTATPQPQNDHIPTQNNPTDLNDEDDDLPF